LQWLKYYLFLRKTTPLGGKYNPLQKLSYGLAVPVLTLCAAYTGFCLWAPTAHWPIFAAGTAWAANLTFGGNGGSDPMNIRVIHYFVMWAVLLFTAIHVYLANIYSFAPSKMMFLWKETTGHDEGKAKSAA
jgi:Ni/Fe-hydrogenase 1 B-type cytochrome subunit